MTAFDLFQRATCELCDGDRAAAAKTIAAAIRRIDKDGVKADLRGDLEELRQMLLVDA